MIGLNCILLCLNNNSQITSHIIMVLTVLHVIFSRKKRTMSGKKPKRDSKTNPEDDTAKAVKKLVHLQGKLAENIQQQFMRDNIAESMDNLQEIYEKMGLEGKELDKLSRIGEQQKQMEQEALTEGFLKQLFKVCVNELKQNDLVLNLSPENTTQHSRIG